MASQRLYEDVPRYREVSPEEEALASAILANVAEAERLYASLTSELRKDNKSYAAYVQKYSVFADREAQTGAMWAIKAIYGQDQTHYPVYGPEDPFDRTPVV